MELRRYLADRSIPVADFAETIGVTAQAVHRYLNGERVPKREVMERICAATDGKVRPNDFFAPLEAA